MKIPDLFTETERGVFGERETGNGKRVGIPRALFFYERFPFWNAFFSALGFEVVLSDASNAALAQRSQENIATETCFPITLAHGHVADLLQKGIDILFLPSLVNMEKSSDKFKENFNCPFIQALPYFIRSGFELAGKVRVLAPPLEPQRGKGYFIKQLLKLGRDLGKNRSETLRAIDKAGKAQAECAARLREKGREILEKNEPALVLISRPYNGADPVLNLGIPRKLRDMGFQLMPMEFLPIDNSDIAHDYPNMYWNYGQKMLAAAHYIRQHPNLTAVQITNFRCGPDSFISHLIKDIFGAKPFLQIEVDEHSSDTGVVTRLEAFLDSLKGFGSRRLNVSASKLEGNREVHSQVSSKKRTLYLPHMCDHAHALAAAMRAFGIEAEVLPPSDGKTLEIGRRHTSGKECHPFIVTTGDFLKKIGEPGFAPDRSAFLMPMASGPCRFGQYRETQQLILRRLGYADLPIVSPDVGDSYSRSMGIDPRFRRRAWQGIVATDLLNETAASIRPYERSEGETDRVYGHFLTEFTRAIEGNSGRLFQLVPEMKEAFASIPLSTVNGKPLIGIVGEIFLRYNPHCNADIVRKIEKLGGKTHTAPISEWFYYTNLGYIYESWMRGRPGYLTAALFSDLVQKWDERRLGHRQPSALDLIRRASPYLHYSFKGEAILTVGKAIDLIDKGAAGIVNIMPFTCMPGTVVSAAMRRLREEHGGIPWLDLPIDGNEETDLETRLEAFMHQARAYSDTAPRDRK